MVNGGRPPLPPRQRRSRPSMTLDTGEGGPKLPIPAIQVKADRGRRWFLPYNRISANLRSSFRFSRPTITLPHATLRQPSPVLPPLSVNLHPSFRFSRPTITLP